MKCPFCGHIEDKVIDSRQSKEGDIIRRRRECLKCEGRFTSYEKIENILPHVIKKDSSRQSFDRHKILQGLMDFTLVGFAQLSGAADLHCIPSEIEVLRPDMADFFIGLSVAEDTFFFRCFKFVTFAK